MKEWIRDIAIFAVIAVIILQFIKPTIIKEHSMEPTLYENHYIFVSKQQYTFGKVKRGDIVVFHTDMETEEGKEKLLIKRIVAIPGDTIEIKDGNVFINDKKIDEPYTLDGFTSGIVEKKEVPEGKIFAMGDNRQNSLDSRNENVGFIDIDEIVGKGIFRLWPLNKIGTIK